MQRFAGKPFVFVGVNADESPERLRRVQEKAQLNWVSWWDGPEGSVGTAWGVDRFPAFFLVDPRGVIRFRQFGTPREGELERKIDELLRESER